MRDLSAATFLGKKGLKEHNKSNIEANLENRAVCMGAFLRLSRQFNNFLNSNDDRDGDSSSSFISLEEGIIVVRNLSTSLLLPSTAQS